ncbi:MAG: hypothetical protein K2L21_05600 [Muribaculaceae bacterium]|nr:hypothetical protein [Muribaculaceae bacterium]
MKYRNLLLAAAAVAWLSGQAQESADTVVALHDVDSVLVCRSDHGLMVRAKGQPYEPGFTYEYEMEALPADSTMQPEVTIDFSTIFGPITAKRERRRRGYTPGDGLYIGAGIPVGGAPLGASVEVGLTSFMDGKIRLGNVCLSAGAGIGYSQWSLDSEMAFDTDHGRLLITTGPENARSTSRLRTWRVVAPVMLYYSIGRKGFIGAGTWLNFNFAASAYTSYRIGNITTRHTFKGLHTRALTPDMAITGGIKWAALYLRYSPTSIFTNGFGPEFKAISVGLISTF